MILLETTNLIRVRECWNANKSKKKPGSNTILVRFGAKPCTKLNDSEDKTSIAVKNYMERIKKYANIFVARLAYSSSVAFIVAPL